MLKKSLLLIIISLQATLTLAQDIKLTPDLYEYSPNSITGVYVCTPTHVKNGDCTDVDKEYYDNLARITLGAYEIGLLEVNNTKTIAFKGPLSPGSAATLISILDNNPEIDTLALSSQGGSEEEAYKIADYVKHHQLNTWVPVRRMCLSACSSIFLSGHEKTLDGILGLHTGTFYINDSYQIRNLEAARKTIQEAMFQNDQFMMKRIRLFTSLGISLDVVDAMIEAKGKFLTFLSMEELLSFDPNKDYVKTTEEMLEISRNLPVKNFDFQNYTQLF